MAELKKETEAKLPFGGENSDSPGKKDSYVSLEKFRDRYQILNGLSVSRNVRVKGRRTSVRLDPEMWKALKEISEREVCSIHEICTMVHELKNPETTFTGALRTFLVKYFRGSL